MKGNRFEISPDYDYVVDKRDRKPKTIPINRQQSRACLRVLCEGSHFSKGTAIGKRPLCEKVYQLTAPEKKLTHPEGTLVETVKVHSFFRGKDARLSKIIYGELVKHEAASYWLEL